MRPHSEMKVIGSNDAAMFAIGEAARLYQGDTPNG